MNTDMTNKETNKEIFERNIKILSELLSGENIQKYILGTKKNGQYRALYDIIIDILGKSKKKKKKKNKDSIYSLYLKEKEKKKSKKDKKDKKKKKKKKKYLCL